MTPPSVTRPLDDSPCTVRLTFDSGATMWADMPRAEATALLEALSRADPFALVPVPGTSRRVAPAHIALWEVEDAPSLDGLFGSSLRPSGARTAASGGTDDTDEEASL